MLGFATARALADVGVPVVVSSRKKVDPLGDALKVHSDLIEVEQVDLLDSTRLREVFKKHDFEGIVLAAHTHQYATKRAQNNQIYFITLNCLELAREFNVRRVIVGGSMAVYGGLTPPLTETAMFPPEVPDPAQADANLMVKFEVATRRALEILTLDYRDSFQMGISVPPDTPLPEPNKLEVAILRAPLMFGPGYAALGSPLGVAAHVAAGRLPQLKGHIGYGGIPVDEAWKKMSFVPVNYVNDNAECIKLSMLADELPHSIYNISSGFSKSPRKQLEAFIAIRPERADRMGISPNDLVDEDIDSGFNSDRFEQDFGWRSPYTLESALTEYINWLEEHPF